MPLFKIFSLVYPISHICDGKELTIIAFRLQGICKMATLKCYVQMFDKLIELLNHGKNKLYMTVITINHSR